MPLANQARSVLLPLAQLVLGKLSPFAKVFKLAGLAAIFIIICLNLPSTRPYTTDLVVKTSDLRQIVTVKPLPLVSDNTPDKRPSSTHIMDCNPDVRRLGEIRDRYELGDQVEYFKRYVRFTREPIARPSYTSLQQSLLPDSTTDKGFQTLDLSTGHQNDQKCGEPLKVSVPQSKFPAEADLSDFIFAISTTFDRLSHPTMISEWAYWLTDGSGKSNGGKLLLMLLDATDPEITDAAQRLADAGIDAEVAAWDSRMEKHMAVRYLSLVPMLYSHQASASRKWLVLCDDDTFFTSTNSVVARFKEYDHTKPMYVGTLSEDMAAIWTHGSQAFGGGGVFISRPLAEIITSVYETCKTRKKVKQSNSGWGPQGDILLRMCIYENTAVRLTELRDLWQLDFSGDASGFYESGIKPYSIHHFKGSKGWHTAYPQNTTKIAHTCGEDCPYQRFVTADNFVISNGYSIAQYPDGIDFDLEQVERTMTSILSKKDWNFDFMLGPQRPLLQMTGKKVAWELRDSQVMEDGSVLQVYVREKGDKRWTTPDGKPIKALDGIIELVWVPA